MGGPGPDERAVWEEEKSSTFFGLSAPDAKSSKILRVLPGGPHMVSHNDFKEPKFALPVGHVLELRPLFHEKTPPQSKKQRAKFGAGDGKKSDFLGGPGEGWSSGHTHQHTTQLRSPPKRNMDWPIMDWPKLDLATFGLTKIGLAKVGHDRSCEQRHGECR